MVLLEMFSFGKEITTPLFFYVLVSLPDQNRIMVLLQSNNAETKKILVIIVTRIKTVMFMADYSTINLLYI